LGAVTAAIAIVLVAIGTAGALGILYFRLVGSGGPGSPALTQAGAMITMLFMQAVIVALVVWMAGWHGASRRRVLSTLEPADARLLLTGFAGMAAILIPYNLAIYLLWPRDFAQDLRPFAELARSPVAGLAALVVALGAPLSEELLFRGFLLPALSRASARLFVGLAIAVLAVQMVVPIIMGFLFPGRVLSSSAAGLVFGLTLWAGGGSLPAHPRLRTEEADRRRFASSWRRSSRRLPGP
jgi:membrane protease YdiL (CAAX protease family)